MMILTLALMLLSLVAIGATIRSLARDGYHRVPFRPSLPRPDRADRR